MRKYLVSLSSLILFFSCIGGKSVPVQLYTLNVVGESSSSINVVQIRAGAKIHQRMNLQNGELLELREFERWQDSPHRILETEMKNYFALGGDELRGELNEFVFDLNDMQAKISVDFIQNKESGDQHFRLKSTQGFEKINGESLAKAMSLAVQDLFINLDKKITEGK
jgi:hypothetical protein